jgi:hypothetical protein
MVAAMVSRDFALMAPIAKRRSAVMFAGPCPVRMVQKSKRGQARMALT